MEYLYWQIVHELLKVVDEIVAFVQEQVVQEDEKAVQKAIRTFQALQKLLQIIQKHVGIFQEQVQEEGVMQILQDLPVFQELMEGIQNQVLVLQKKTEVIMQTVNVKIKRVICYEFFNSIAATFIFFIAWTLIAEAIQKDILQKYFVIVSSVYVILCSLFHYYVFQKSTIKLIMHLTYTYQFSRIFECIAFLINSSYFIFSGYFLSFAQETID